VSLLAEGRARHYDEAILDMERAGIRMSQRQLRAHLPPGMREILFTGRVIGPVPPLLPEFDTVSDCPDLPGWVRLTRE
jgi:hypothetical protein